MHARRPLATITAGFVALAGLALVSPSSASAVEVGDEAALRAAFADPAEVAITLTADITIACDGDNQIVRSDPTDDLVIDGGGHTITFPCSDGNESLFVVGDSPASFNTLTLRDLRAVDTGTGYALAFVDGFLVLEDVETDGWGDVLRADTVTVARSYLHGAAEAVVRPDSDATVVDSTLAGGETAIQASGNGSTPVVVRNSTIVGMESSGIDAVDVALELEHVTFADNARHLNVGGSLMSTGSAYGPADQPCSLDAEVTGGYNADLGACWPAEDAASTDRQDLTSAEMALGALSGEPRPVHRLGTGSVLIDAIPAGSCPLAADELGTARPQGAGCDVGAVEVLAAAAPTPPAPGPTPAPAAQPTPATPRFTG